MTDFESVLRARRSLRLYDSTPIPEAVVRKVLSLALLAPNSSNLQPWEFYWVRSTEKKAALVEACFSQSAAKTAAELFVAVARIDTWKRNRNLMLEYYSRHSKTPKSAIEYYKKLVPFVYTQGIFSCLGFLKKLLYLVTGIFRIVPREPTSKSELKLWASKSTALACQNFMLAMKAEGFDSCPMEGLDSSRVKRILGLPRSATIVMAISAGKGLPGGVYGEQIRFDEKLFLKEV